MQESPGSAERVSPRSHCNERLLSVRREPCDGQSPDPASEIRWMLTGAAPEQPAAPATPAVQAASSTPPPGA